MSRTTFRTTSGIWTYVLVATSPAMTATPVVTIVSHATRESGSSASMASSTASEIWSATLSGWPGKTDSEVNKRLDIEALLSEQRLRAELSHDGRYAHAAMFRQRRKKNHPPGPPPSAQATSNKKCRKR